MGAAWWSPWSAEQLEDGWTDGRTAPDGSLRASVQMGCTRVLGGGGRRSWWLSGLTIDRDEEALRGGGGGAEGKEGGYLVGVQSVPCCCGPRRLAQSPTGSGSGSIPRSSHFLFFSARMQISLVCHPCGEVARADDAQTGASPHTHAYKHSHTPLVVLHTRAMSSA